MERKNSNFVSQAGFPTYLMDVTEYSGLFTGPLWTRTPLTLIDVCGDDTDGSQRSELTFCGCNTQQTTVTPGVLVHFEASHNGNNTDNRGQLIVSCNDGLGTLVPVMTFQDTNATVNGRLIVNATTGLDSDGALKLSSNGIVAATFGIGPPDVTFVGSVTAPSLILTGPVVWNSANASGGDSYPALPAIRRFMMEVPVQGPQQTGSLEEALPMIDGVFCDGSQIFEVSIMETIVDTTVDPPTTMILPPCSGSSGPFAYEWRINDGVLVIQLGAGYNLVAGQTATFRVWLSVCA